MCKVLFYGASSLVFILLFVESVCVCTLCVGGEACGGKVRRG